MEKHFSLMLLKHIFQTIVKDPDAKSGRSKKQVLEQISKWKALTPNQKYLMSISIKKLNQHGKLDNKKHEKLDLVNFLLMNHPCILRVL